MTKYKNMRTPFWNFIDGLIMIGTGLIKILTFGLKNPNWYGNFMDWKLRQMFKIVK